MNQKKKIAIVGGGLLGLCTAYYLTRNEELEITIFEKEQVLGGLVSSVKINGENVEKFYHHIFPQDNNILNLIEQLGLKEKVYFKELDSTIYRNGKFLKLDTPKSVLKYPTANFFEKLKFGMSLFYLKKCKLVNANNDVSVSSWYKQKFGKRIYTEFVKPVLKSKFGNETENISLRWFADKIRSRAKTGRKFGYLKGGFGNLVERLEKKLLNCKVKIVKSCEIQKVDKNENGKILLGYEVFDKVVLTIHPNKASKIVPLKNERLEQKFAKFKWLGAISMIVVSKREFISSYWNTICDKNVFFKIIVNHSRLMHKSRKEKDCLYYLGAYFKNDDEIFALSEKEIKAKWIKCLLKLFPRLKLRDIEAVAIFRNRYAQHIVTSSIPKFKDPIVKLSKNIYSTNFSLVYPEDRSLDLAVRQSYQLSAIGSQL